LAAKSENPLWKIFDVNADAISAEWVRRVDHGDCQLELAHDRQNGDGERTLSARRRAQQQLRDAATIVHRRPQRGKFDNVNRPSTKNSGSATLGSRATTAPELIKGRTNFKTGAVTRLRF
jgi:hypothetical protein